MKTTPKNTASKRVGTGDGSALDDALIRYHERLYGKRPPDMSSDELLDVLRRWESVRAGAQGMLSRRAMRKRVKAHAKRHAPDLLSPNNEPSERATSGVRSPDGQAPRVH